MRKRGKDCVFPYFYKHKFWVAVPEKIRIGSLWVAGENVRKMGYRDRIYEHTFLNSFFSGCHANIIQNWKTSIKSRRMVERYLHSIHIFWCTGDHQVAKEGWADAGHEENKSKSHVIWK